MSRVGWEGAVRNRMLAGTLRARQQPTDRHDPMSVVLSQGGTTPGGILEGVFRCRCDGEVMVKSSRALIRQELGKPAAL